MNKYYKIIIPALGVISIILLIILIIPGKNNNQENIQIEEKKDVEKILMVDVNDIVFKLKGDINYQLDINDEYIEPGFIAYLKNGVDLTDCVTIINDNIVENGTYKIKYVLEYENIKLTLSRKITLKNKKSEIKDEGNTNSDDLTLKLNGDETVYILIGNLYKDRQASAIDKIDGDISSNIKTIGTVNTNKVGEYIITYSVENSKKQSRSVKRKVVVYDYKYEIIVNRTSSNLSFVLTNTDDYIKYMMINDKKYDIDKKVTILTLDDNKEYKVKLYDKYNYIKEENYNFIKPNLTCNAKIDSNKTIVTTTISSNNIIKYNYYFNNQKYESTRNTYTLQGSYKNVYVEAIDSNNNSNKVSCIVSETIGYFDSGLKELSYDGWNYYLYVPKNVKKNEKTPLIVFLHGSEERGSNLKLLDSYGFAKYIKKGQSYDAFILIPQLPKNSYWTDDDKSPMKLINKVVNDYNIDENKISLSGFSLGAMGIPTIIKKNQNYFSCVVMIAVGGNKKGFASYFKNIPVRFYAGSKDTRLGNSSDTKAFINAVKKVNSNVYSKVFSGAPHNVVDRTLEDGSVAKWMIEQTKK